MPELDVLRFFAFLSIFVFHLLKKDPGGPLSDMRVAVETSLRYAVSLFFLLSAFLITALLDEEVERTGKLHVKAFYIRRIARIWPVYFFVLLLSLVTEWRFFPGWHTSKGVILAFVLMVGNWSLAWGAKLTGPLVAMWSVNVEEQFYLLVPLTVGRFKRAGLVGVSMVAILASYGTLLWMGAHPHPVRTEESIRLNSLVEMQFFAVGTLLALGLKRRQWQASWAARAALLLTGAVTWTASVYLFDVKLGKMCGTIVAPAAGYALVLAGCVCLFLGFLGMQVRAVFKPLVWLGKISYGLYAYHLWVLTMVPMIWPTANDSRMKSQISHGLGLVLTVVVSAISYQWLEKPSLRLKQRFTYVANREA